MIPVHSLGEIDSTSREAARRAAAGEFGPVWLHSDTQTAGRGRSDRVWDSARGNLFATLLMPFEGAVGTAALRSFTACLAVARTLDALIGAPERVTLKWPNDALLDGRKVAGVLLEAGEVKRQRWLSIGIGVNLAHAPETARWPTVCVADVTDAPAPEPLAALALLSDALAEEERHLREGGFALTRERWIARAARLGEQIEARLPLETLAGRFDGIAGDGALLLGMADGQRRIAAADIHFPDVTTQTAEAHYATGH